MTGTGGSIQEDTQKRGEEKDVSFRAVVPFVWQLEVSEQRTHLIGTSLHPASWETPAGGQRNAGTGYDARLLRANAPNGG